MEELNPAPPKTNPSSGREEDLKPGPPDYKSNALPLGHARLPKAFTFVLPKQVDNLIDFQEYPTEPLDKIPALQGRIALAGKLNIDHMHLLENLYEHHAGWEFMLQRWF